MFLLVGCVIFADYFLFSSIMEANKLQKKKSTLNRGQLKKTIKNVLCRPDPVFWPVVSEENSKIIDNSLSKYKVEIAEFHKPLWKELKNIPKHQRPKAPKLRKVNGLLFGISQTSSAVHDGNCKAIIIESSVNPRILVEPLIETCVSAEIPVLCLNGMKDLTLKYFGITTCCLGITDSLSDIINTVKGVAKQYKAPKNTDKTLVERTETRAEKMVIDEPIPHCLLFRTDKKTRVFIPPSNVGVKKSKSEFSGQDFIEFSEKLSSTPENNRYKNMLLKRLKSNPNRVKVK